MAGSCLAAEEVCRPGVCHSAEKLPGALIPVIEADTVPSGDHADPVDDEIAVYALDGSLSLFLREYLGALVLVRQRREKCGSETKITV